MTQETPTITECSRCHRKSEIVRMNGLCTFCVSKDDILISEAYIEGYHIGYEAGVHDERGRIYNDLHKLYVNTDGFAERSIALDNFLTEYHESNLQ